MPDEADLRRDDLLLDRLAAGHPPPPDDPLAAWLAAWRDEVRQ